MWDTVASDENLVIFWICINVFSLCIQLNLFEISKFTAKRLEDRENRCYEILWHFFERSVQMSSVQTEIEISSFHLEIQKQDSVKLRKEKQLKL